MNKNIDYEIHLSGHHISNQCPCGSRARLNKYVLSPKTAGFNLSGSGFFSIVKGRNELIYAGD